MKIDFVDMTMCDNIINDLYTIQYNMITCH